MLTRLDAPTYAEWRGLDAHLEEVAAEVRASGPKLSKDGVVTSTEVGVQLEGVETRRATVDLAKSRATLLLSPLARPPRLEALVEVGAERGA